MMFVKWSVLSLLSSNLVLLCPLSALLRSLLPAPLRLLYLLPLFLCVTVVVTMNVLFIVLIMVRLILASISSCPVRVLILLARRGRSPQSCRPVALPVSSPSPSSRPVRPVAVAPASPPRLFRPLLSPQPVFNCSCVIRFVWLVPVLMFTPFVLSLVPLLR